MGNITKRSPGNTVKARQQRENVRRQLAALYADRFGVLGAERRAWVSATVDKLDALGLFHRARIATIGKAGP